MAEQSLFERLIHRFGHAPCADQTDFLERLIGTPGGVGAARTPPEFMHPGDTVEVEITGVGLLRHTIKEG